MEDFPRVWKDSRTSDRERKRMVRLLLEDVTVLRQEDVITAHVRFKGGATHTITVPVGRGRCSSPELIALIDQLLATSPMPRWPSNSTSVGGAPMKGTPLLLHAWCPYDAITS